MEKEENGIGLGTAIEQPQEENELKLSYWLKNHKFTVILFSVLIISSVWGIVSFIQQCVENWKATLLLVGALSPILILGIVAIIWAIIENTKNKKNDKNG